MRYERMERRMNENRIRARKMFGKSYANLSAEERALVHQINALHRQCAEFKACSR